MQKLRLIQNLPKVGYNAKHILSCTVLVQQQHSALAELQGEAELATVQLQTSSPADNAISVKTHFKYLHCVSDFSFTHAQQAVKNLNYSGLSEIICLPVIPLSCIPDS